MKKESSRVNKLKSPSSKIGEDNLCAVISRYFISKFQIQIEKYFDVVEENLFNMADNARSNNKQNLYLSTVNLIRNNKEKLTHSYLKSLEEIFNSFKNNNLSFCDSMGLKNKKSFSMELIDENELNESLTVSNLIRKSNTAYQKQLYALKIRFAHIISSKEINIEQLPLSPFVIINTYANCLSLINLTSEVKLEIYKIFERLVMGNMNDIYSTINKHLRDCEVVPIIDYSVQKQKISKRENNKSHYSNNKQNKKEHNLESEQLPFNEHSFKQPHLKNEQSLDYNYQSILQILKSSRAIVNKTKYNSNNINNFEKEKHLKDDLASFTHYLSKTQKHLTKQKKLPERLANNPIEISRDISDYFQDKRHPRFLSQKDEDIIDLTGLLFQFIIDSENLPNKIQIILSKLQIPFLKVALNDGNLFANKNHEARILLNSLAKASLGWNEEVDQDGKFIAKISEITQHILDIEYLSPKVFELLQMNFDNFLKKTNKKFKIIQERTRKTTLAHEKIVQAKNASANLLMSRIKSNNVLPCIRDLLIVDWFNVINLMFLRFSEDSDELNDNINFVGNIINYTQIKNTGTRKRLDGILYSYEEGLKMVAYNPREMQLKIEFLKELLYEYCSESITEKANKLDSSNIFTLDEVRNKQRELFDIIDDNTEINQDLENYSKVEDKYYQIAKTLKIGTWLNFKNIAKKSIRAKLSWISPLSHKYLFVNSKGIKITHKSCVELAYGFKNKKIHVIDSSTIFDLALYTISKKLKNNKKAVDLKNINI